MDQNKSPQFQTDNPWPRDPVAVPLPVTRFKIKDFIDTSKPPNSPQLLKCVRWDGVNEGTKYYIVRPRAPHSTNDDIYAFRPQGGTSWTFLGSVTGADRQVVWLEWDVPSAVLVSFGSATTTTGVYQGTIYLPTAAKVDSPTGVTAGPACLIINTPDQNLVDGSGTHIWPSANLAGIWPGVLGGKDKATGKIIVFTATPPAQLCS